ncbi:MAG: hypothetical protein ACQESN_08900 [Thermotogota bacterium]
MLNNIILVEGLPGVGKTTISKLIKQILQKKNIKSKLYLEGDKNQPADYESVAFLNEKEYIDILKKHPENSKIIENITQKNKKGLKGTIEVLKKRQEIEHKILNNLKIKYQVINNSNYKISKTKKVLEELFFTS